MISYAKVKNNTSLTVISREKNFYTIALLHIIDITKNYATVFNSDIELEDSEP